jgi:Integrase core domain
MSNQWVGDRLPHWGQRGDVGCLPSCWGFTLTLEYARPHNLVTSESEWIPANCWHRRAVDTYRIYDGTDENGNAPMESSWGSMQIELLNRQHWRTNLQLAVGIADYIENFYNVARRHSTLNYRVFGSQRGAAGPRSPRIRRRRFKLEV